MTPFTTKPEDIRAENNRITSLLKSSIAKEENKKSELRRVDEVMIIDSGKNYLTLHNQNEALKIHLCKFLDEFEGAWDNDEQCASPEIAEDYLAAAKFMADNFGRINNRIRGVEEWANNYLPFK